MKYIYKFWKLVKRLTGRGEPKDTIQESVNTESLFLYKTGNNITLHSSTITISVETNESVEESISIILQMILILNCVKSYLGRKIVVHVHKDIENFLVNPTNEISQLLVLLYDYNVIISTKKGEKKHGRDSKS